MTFYVAESWTCVALYFDIKFSGCEYYSGCDDVFVVVEKVV